MQGTQTLPHPKGLLQKNAPHMTRESGKRARAQVERPNTPARFGLGPIHALASMSGQRLEPSSEQARCHPQEEGYEQVSTVVRHAQGQEQRIQPSPESQGQQQNFGPIVREKTDKEQGHLWKLQTKSSDFDSRPMRAAYPAARHHRLGGDYAFEASTGGKSDSASRYTPRISAEVREQH